jgi:hypothetical protein
MSNALNIYNENFGYQVATNGTYVAIGNPNSKPYSCQEGFIRIGEVLVYQKNRFQSNYSFAKTYRRQASAPTVVNQSSYGKALAMCDDWLAVADTAYSQSTSGTPTSGCGVDIYRLYNTSPTASCDTDPASWTLDSTPAYSITYTGNVSDKFGQAVAISDNFMVVGVPGHNSDLGKIMIYRYDGASGFVYYKTVVCPDVGQKLFGAAVSIDKLSEDRIAVGTLTTTQSRVYVYDLTNDANVSVTLRQGLEQNTASKWLQMGGDNTISLYPSGSNAQTHTRYGSSVAISSGVLIVGAPNDLIYYEYSGSVKVRQRGAAYAYYTPSGSGQYTLEQKLYGDGDTFKDNLFGYSVDVNDNYILIGSPKPYFPFSSVYLSASVDRYNLNFDDDDFGASTYNGQTLLYRWTTNQCSGSTILNLATTAPISYRKRISECFTAFGESVALSNDNIVIGAPAPLDDDLYLQTPLLTEQSDTPTTGCSTDPVAEIVELAMEDAICDCTGDNINSGTGRIVYVTEQPVVVDIFGKAFIYNFSDLQKDAVVGNVFYNNDKFIVNNTGSILRDLLRDPTNTLTDYIYGSYQSQITLNEKQFICTIEPGEFNISTNPTAITGSAFDYAISNDEQFNFTDLDLILRYINSKLTTNRSEYWWDVLVEGDIQQSQFTFFTSAMYNYTQSKLTPELKCVLNSKNFDINNDGIVDYSDAYMLWNYYIENLEIVNYKQYISPTSRRNNYDDIIKFLDTKTGKGFGNKIKNEFFAYHISASLDPTGSYLAPYITDVGLYAGADLVAIGKIASPIKNNGQIPINIVVKWDT